MMKYSNSLAIAISAKMFVVAVIVNVLYSDGSKFSIESMHASGRRSVTPKPNPTVI